MTNGQRSIGERRLAAVVTLLLAALLFAALGAWQLARAGEQDERLKQARSALAAPPVDLRKESVTPAHAYRRAVGMGEFLPDQYFLEGRSEAGRAGYGVVAVLRAGNRHILVDRGYARTAQGSAPRGAVRVEGVLAPARLPVLSFGEPHGSVRPFLDPRAISRELGIEVSPLVLQAKPPPLPPLKSAMHLGYAIQWFVFALVAVIAVVALFRNR